MTASLDPQVQVLADAIRSTAERCPEREAIAINAGLDSLLRYAFTDAGDLEVRRERITNRILTVLETHGTKGVTLSELRRAINPKYTGDEIQAMRAKLLGEGKIIAVRQEPSSRGGKPSTRLYSVIFDPTITSERFSTTVAKYGMEFAEEHTSPTNAILTASFADLGSQGLSLIWEIEDPMILGVSTQESSSGRPIYYDSPAANIEAIIREWCSLHRPEELTS